MSYNIFKDLKLYDIGESRPVVYHISDDSNVFPKDFSTREVSLSMGDYSPEKLLKNIWKWDRSGLDFCPNAKDKEDFVEMGLKHLGNEKDLNKLKLKLKTTIEVSEIEEKELFEKISDFKEIINVSDDFSEDRNRYGKEKEYRIIKGTPKNNSQFFRALINELRVLSIYTLVEVKKRTQVKDTLESAFENRTKQVGFEELTKIVKDNPGTLIKAKLEKRDSRFKKTCYFYSDPDGKLYVRQRSNSNSSYPVNQPGLIRNFKNNHYTVFV